MTNNSKIVQLNYQFIFEPGSDSWSNIGEFENDLQDFFAANGLQIEIAIPISGNGLPGIMMIKKIEETETLENKKGPQLSANPSMGKAQKSRQMVSGLTRQLTNTTSGGRKV